MGKKTLGYKDGREKGPSFPIEKKEAGGINGDEMD